MAPTIVTPNEAGIGRLPTVIDENPEGVEIRGEYQNLILAGFHVYGGPLKTQRGSRAYMTLLSGAEFRYGADLLGLSTKLLLAQGIATKYLRVGDVSDRIDVSGSAIEEFDLTYQGYTSDLDICNADIGVLDFGEDPNRKMNLDANGIFSVREVRGSFPAELHRLSFDDEKAIIPEDFRTYLRRWKDFLSRR